MVAIAGIVAVPLIILGTWQAIDSPAAFDRFAGRYLLAALATFFLTVLAIKNAQRRARHGVRSLHRVIRRIESGDHVGPIDSFPEPEFQRMAETCAVLGERLVRAENALTELRERFRIEMSRYESVVEQLQMSNYNLSAESGALHALGTVLSRDLGTAQICSELITNLAAKIMHSHAAVFLYDKDHSELIPRAIRDPQNPVPLVGDFLGQLPTGDHAVRAVSHQAAQSGRSYCIADTHADPRCADVRPETRSVLIVPLRASGSVTGVVQLEHPHRNAFDPSDQRVAQSMATTAAVAIENVLLIQNTAELHALQKIDRLKTDLLWTVSHELRTPLASISGYADTLLRKDVEFAERDRRDFLAIIVDECTRLNDFIEDLLQMSQIEAGILKVNRQSMRIDPIVERIVRSEQSRTTNHTIVFDQRGPLPALNADEKRVTQVFRNLIENAIKYSPDGGTVTVRGDVIGNEAVFEVSDQGIGIAAIDIDRVFERFFRAEAKAVRNAGGTGLGLSICRGIVETHGGRIWVESRQNEGSTFRFTLPLAQKQVIRVNSQEEPQ